MPNAYRPLLHRLSQEEHAITLKNPRLINIGTSFLHTLCSVRFPRGRHENLDPHLTFVFWIGWVDCLAAAAITLARFVLLSHVAKGASALCLNACSEMQYSYTGIGRLERARATRQQPEDSASLRGAMCAATRAISRAPSHDGAMCDLNKPSHV